MTKVGQPLQLLGPHEVKRVILAPEEVVAYESDPEAFAARYVNGEIGDLRTDTPPDGITTLTIKYRPFLPPLP